MKRIIFGAAIAVALAAVVHSQASITGKWEGETPNGARLVLDLTAAETALTGTLTRNDQSTAISDGQVSDGTFTFKATLNDQTEGFTGKVAADEMKVWLDRQGPERAALLRRVKD
jgi:opacity protein-like surface antigen